MLKITKTTWDISTKINIKTKSDPHDMIDQSPEAEKHKRKQHKESRYQHRTQVNVGEKNTEKDRRKTAGQEKPPKIHIQPRAPFHMVY